MFTGYKIIGGIPVPGRSIPALRIFEFYQTSCVPSTRQSAISLDQLRRVRISRFLDSDLVGLGWVFEMSGFCGVAIIFSQLLLLVHARRAFR